MRRAFFPFWMYGIIMYELIGGFSRSFNLLFIVYHYGFSNVI